MSTSITIRPADVQDLPAIHELVRELAIYEKEEAAFTASLEDYQRDFTAGVFDCIVAEQEAQIVGMVLYYMSYSTWKGKMLFLEDFVVKEDWRQAGIGQVLFDAFLDKAKELECRLVKWQVLDWNKPALAFYHKNAAIIETNWWNGKIFLKNQPHEHI
ncbi:MAG: GNAT family N-acetyltransferase [Saprospiraceae bacterium]